MIRAFVVLLLCLISTLGATGCNPFDAFDNAIKYERMQDQDSIRPYETKMPAVVLEAIPADGGENRYRLAPQGNLRNPLSAAPESIQRGALCYEFYCIQCHGSKYNGDGIVGQSFYPLPTDLRSAAVQDTADDPLFRSISYGFGRHPPLAYTVSVEDRWHLIHWIRSLGPRTGQEEPIPSGDYHRSVQAIP
jgi:mono/diheme cytochrome c family protein